MVRMQISSNITSDVIEGKGKGLIILLHGGPGTGKTLTAESVAELAERPLYRVTCGDIGTSPDSVESYLESVLYIGSAWKAGKPTFCISVDDASLGSSYLVVLLDESDVFLEEREKSDLQRNALVSVFLRVLEYYDGILILTSNRGTKFAYYVLSLIIMLTSHQLEPLTKPSSLACSLLSTTQLLTRQAAVKSGITSSSSLGGRATVKIHMMIESYR